MSHKDQSATATFKADPSRFNASKWTLWVDRFMNQFIKIGGISIITVVFGIFVFIAWQIWPLFVGAKVQEEAVHQLPTDATYVALGVDEYGELPFTMEADGTFTFYDLVGDRGHFQRRVDLSVDHVPEPSAAVDDALAAAEGEAVEGVEALEAVAVITSGADREITAFSYQARRQEFYLGTNDGYVGVVKVNYEPVFVNNQRTMEVEVLTQAMYPVAEAGGGGEIISIGYGDGGANKLVGVVQNEGGELRLRAMLLAQERTLFGSGDTVVSRRYDLKSDIEGTPIQVLVNRNADVIVCITQEGNAYYFYRTGDQIEMRQVFRPFEGFDEQRVASADYLFGDASIIFTSKSGENVVYSQFTAPGATFRTFGRTKAFPSLGAGATFFSGTVRNKAFLIGHGNFASLRYATTETIRWEDTLPFEVKLARVGMRYTSMYFLDTENKLHAYKLTDHHPSAGWKAFFGKLWYEGSEEAKFEWQSTGGSDEFEPKLSVMPLIFGTLKGTLYAMLFAVPIALLAALYVSQFAHPDVRRIVKPTMEIMASLPSVVLGFLAALWLAPLVETKVPSVLLSIIALPTVAALMGMGWMKLPPRARIWVQGGHEWWLFAPVLLITLVVAWNLGPVVERIFFTVADPETGRRVADFRLWWPEATGTIYSQRNSMVVGFMMGFAVIPIIFTIAEDSLSNVPGALRSGSLALGASRWQTAMHIVLPTASPGIFSALMIGLGRAVGETMIVVMATGNTPVMEWNIFSGMRTLSANIAVELPEAAHHSTLYRTLFLGAMALFLMTFIVNTGAEVLRQHLREKYKTV